jgi:hypothetical protein
MLGLRASHAGRCLGAGGATGDRALAHTSNEPSLARMDSPRHALGQLSCLRLLTAKPPSSPNPRAPEAPSKPPTLRFLTAGVTRFDLISVRAVNRCRVSQPSLVRRGRSAMRSECPRLRYLPNRDKENDESDRLPRVRLT